MSFLKFKNLLFVLLVGFNTAFCVSDKKLKEINENILKEVVLCSMEQYLDKDGNRSSEEEIKVYEQLKKEYLNLSQEEFDLKLMKSWNATKLKFECLIDHIFIDATEKIFIPDYLIKNQALITTSALVNIVWEKKQFFVQKEEVIVKKEKIGIKKVKNNSNWLLITLFILLTILIIFVFFLIKKSNYLEGRVKRRDLEIDSKKNKIEQLKLELLILNKKLSKDKVVKESPREIHIEKPISTPGNNISVEKIPVVIEPELQEKQSKNILYFEAPDEGRFFTMENASKTNSADSLYQIEFDGKQGALSINKDASFVFPLNNPDLYFKGACNQLNEKDSTTRSIKVIEKGKVIESGGKLIIDSPIKIKFI